MIKFMLKSPLTVVVGILTLIVAIDKDWPPVREDRVVTLAVPLVLWVAYMAVELYYRQEER